MGDTLNFRVARSSSNLLNIVRQRSSWCEVNNVLDISDINAQQ